LDSASKAASCCFSAWKMTNIAAAQAKPMQVSNILKLASFRKIKMNKAGNVF
jgi:hypothetical protein